MSHLATNTVDYGVGCTPPARGIDTVKLFMNMWHFAVNEYKSGNEIAVSNSDYVLFMQTGAAHLKIISLA